MQKIEFLGASGGEVTGSCYLVTSDDSNQILVDFGMFQGDNTIKKRNYEPLAFNPGSLQGVFLTHAHLDHSGRLPLLVYGGFRGKIYMTAATKALVDIILSDSARIAEKEAEIVEPLYTIEEVAKTLNMIQIVEYNEDINVGSFTATYRDAGHILGSASIEITDTSSDQKEKAIFSGDLGNTPQPLVKPTQYIEQADFVIMESTYGDSTHPEEDPTEIIQEEINTIEQTGGVLLIPAFALERTQEILHIIHHLKEEGKVQSSTPVYLDSPMGINATSVYLNHTSFFSDELNEHTNYPFNFDGLVITDSPRASKEILKDMGPKVIIAGSGMMSGGRIIHHALSYLSDETTRLLFVGYQSEETLGRQILEGAKIVTIEKENIPVKAHIREIKALSSHADLPRLLKWLESIKGVKKVFLTHGELPQQQNLYEKIKELGVKEVYLPKQGEEFNLHSH